jgi:5-methyltetrahydropteroyltriglutamate--homocysteine methyltransferase
VAYGGAVRAFADAGCRYLQLDEVNLAYLCDPEQRRILRQRGDDPDRLPGLYAGLINSAIGGRPADMTITMHLCRGNFRSSWIAQGGYEPVADMLFNQIGVDGYFMEFDTEPAGGFEPLRFVPRNKVVVLGLVTSKTGCLRSAGGTGAYWYALAAAMVCAFAGLAWVRSHFPAIGKLQATGATAR